MGLITSLAGESAMLTLQEKISQIGHTLEELMRALANLRQARLIVMHAAKQRLQELSRKPSQLTAEQIRWMQALRYIEESTTDELHKNLIEECTSVRAAASQARMSDLKASLQRNLSKLVDRVNSAELQGRFTGASSRSLTDEGQRLNRMESLGGVSETSIRALKQ